MVLSHALGAVDPFKIGQPRGVHGPEGLLAERMLGNQSEQDDDAAGERSRRAGGGAGGSKDDEDDDALHFTGAALVPQPM